MKIRILVINYTITHIKKQRSLEVKLTNTRKIIFYEYIKQNN